MPFFETTRTCAPLLRPFSALYGFRSNGDFLYRFLVGRDNRCATPGQAIDLHAVYLETVGIVPSAIRNYLHLILGLENTARSAGPSGSYTARQILRITPIGAASVGPKRSRSELDGLEGHPGQTSEAPEFAGH